MDTTNEPLADNNAHSRGVASKSADGESLVVSNGHRGNLGFTDTLPIDPLYDSEVKETDLRVLAGASTPLEGTRISGSLTAIVGGNPNIVVTGLNGVQCGQTSVSYECVVPSGLSNAGIELSGYGTNNITINRYACSIDTSLTKDGAASVTNGENAKAVFSVTGKLAGTDYNFVIQETVCSLVPIAVPAA